MSNPKLLFKIAKELNVGTQTIVEHLIKKGFDIENKPNAKVSSDMENELMKDPQFKSSIAIKEQADQLVIGTRPAPVVPKKEVITPIITPNKDKPPVLQILQKREKEKTAPPPPPPTPEVVPVAPPPPITVRETPTAPAPVEPVAAPSAPVPVEAAKDNNFIERQKTEAPGLKILGKVNLDRINETNKRHEQPKKQEPRRDQQQGKKPDGKPRDDNRNSNNNPRREDNRSGNNNPRREDNRLGSNNNPRREEQRKDQVKPAMVTPPTPPIVPPTVIPADVPPTSDLPTTPGEDNNYYRAEAPQLKGLTVLGKVDLKAQPSSSDNRNRNNRNRGGQGAGTASDDPNKRKRKRKKVSVGTVAEGEAAKQQNGDGTTNNNNNQGGGQNRQGGNNQGGGQNRQGGNSQGGGQNRQGGNNQGGGQNRQGGNNQGGGQNRPASPSGVGTGNNRPIVPNTQGQNRQGGTGGGGYNRPGGGTGGGYNRPGGGTGGGAYNRPGMGTGTGTGTPSRPGEVSKKEIDDKIKATMARMGGGGKNKRSKVRRSNRDRIRERQEALELEGEIKTLQLTEFITASEIASLMDVPVTDIIMTCMNMGVIVSINQRLDAEVIELIASEFGHEVEFISAEEQLEAIVEEEDAPEDMLPRAPIVTVMGHVDHGKTSLLDYIRKANVVSGESGGITQHIGAYEVKLEDGRKVTFLDTPGHEAFTAMRARGAKVTDIAVVIVAADDSVMPQTREAISHAQAAGVPIVFAINKIDKAGADAEKVKAELARMNFLVEDWGGTYQSQDISAKKGTGIPELLEKILLQAEMLELKANPNKRAVGTVIEASLDKGRGYVTKILVEEGTLKEGDPMVAGEHSGKIKAMFNERGTRVKAAGPAAPVLILGLSGAPTAGEKFKVMPSETDARQLASKRMQISREQANRTNKRISLDEIGRRLALGTFKELKLIIKGDVDGSVEALADALIKQSIETVQVNVIHKAVGQIIDSDVTLASASDAIIIGFQVRPSATARKLAEQDGVEIKTYSIIYEAIEEIRSAIEGMLEPTKEEKILGQIEVRQVYSISKVGTIAGCYVQEGKVERKNYIRVIRDGIVVFPTRENTHGQLGSLKRFKEDVKEVRTNFECGLMIDNYNDIKVGDNIEVYEIIEVKQKLK
jgi:translation initiation factor IF-2